MTIKSQKRTTQGDPLAMLLYALATIPFIKEVSVHSDLHQVWYMYVDDSAAVGKIFNRCQWWDSLPLRGLSYGYFANSVKTWLVVKEEMELEAQLLFRNKNINISFEEIPYLHVGSPLGSQAYVESFVHSKVDS